VSKETKEKKKKKKRSVKPRMIWMDGTFIADSLRLLERAIHENPKAFPEYQDETIDNIRHHYFNYMSRPDFFGLIVKRGRKPIGQIVGRLMWRTLGKPQKFCMIAYFWINPEERGKGLMKQLAAEYFSALKKLDITWWEANTVESITAFLSKTGGSVKVKKLYDRIGGET